VCRGLLAIQVLFGSFSQQCDCPANMCPCTLGPVIHTQLGGDSSPANRARVWAGALRSFVRGPVTGIPIFSLVHSDPRYRIHLYQVPQVDPEHCVPALQASSPAAIKTFFLCC